MKTQQKVMRHALKVLGLKTNQILDITMSPNKSNIKICVEKVENTLEMAMVCLVDALGELKETFPRTRIYVNSITDIAKLYDYITRELPECNKYDEMFHF